MAEAKIKTTIEFYPDDFERLREYADKHDVGLATAIIGLLDGKRPRNAFVPPTVEDVRSHCREKGYTFDPEAFVAFYESKGWTIGREKMRKWKSACVTWQKREKASEKKSKYPTPEEVREFNKSMVGASAGRYYEVFKMTFGCEPEGI